jgi:hypothetical protein
MPVDDPRLPVVLDMVRLYIVAEMLHSCRNSIVGRYQPVAYVLCCLLSSDYSFDASSLPLLAWRFVILSGIEDGFSLPWVKALIGLVWAVLPNEELLRPW